VITWYAVGVSDSARRLYTVTMSDDVQRAIIEAASARGGYRGGYSPGNPDNQRHASELLTLARDSAVRRGRHARTRSPGIVDAVLTAYELARVEGRSRLARSLAERLTGG
jgi:hypothetical protein